MNLQQSTTISTKTLMVLFEKNCNDVQMESVRSLLNIFAIEKKIPHEDMVLAKVHPEAVLLKSTKLVEKGFPMAYFIQSKKFLGVHEIMGSSAKVDDLVAVPRTPEAIDGLTTFFRGCEVIENPDLVEALQMAIVSKDAEASNLKLDIGLTSKVIDSTIWSVKWGVNSAWNYTSSLLGSYGPEGEERKSKLDSSSEPPASIGNPIDIEVIRTNWYSRPQRRIYRFHESHFERIDPEGSLQKGEEIKASFKYSDVSQISIENSNELIINFHDARLEAQYLNCTSGDANRLVNIICTRSPWTSSVSVLRNLEIKMKKLKVSTVVIDPVIPAFPMGTPRWKKDGLAIAYQDEISWKYFDLETLPLSEVGEISAKDFLHFKEEYLAKKIYIPAAVVNSAKPKVINASDLEEFLEISHVQVDYAESRGFRTNFSGFSAEIMDVLGQNCILFVTRENSPVWKKNHEKLYLHHRKCSGNFKLKSQDEIKLKMWIDEISSGSQSRWKICGLCG
eukprot:TRINITY_DN4818_c0_g1_i2.p1 TRINITY_DN4818_c0_g1~~TRINITY_DN4818_c0_g1_i2.p1  ORF type:complete len:505 (+),score=156.50 TRINITY_DN4818_c0_g1_i2:209-1723(+)